MGEVYRARDTHLEQEARAAAHISHPNVVAVYDVASINGATAIVSELLEDETLGQRLARGRIPAAKAVRYAIHIAEGLACGDLVRVEGCTVVRCTSLRSAVHRADRARVEEEDGTPKRIVRARRSKASAAGAIARGAGERVTSRRRR
jgi:serine/threonine protein kinase